MSKMYELFATDGDAEVNGVYADYGPFRVKIARAGGNNKRFQKVLDRLARPYRRAIQTDTMDPEKADEIMREAYAEAVVLGWEVKDENGGWRDGIGAVDSDEVHPVSKQNVLKILTDLPDLFRDLQDVASKASLFLQTTREEAAKNSPGV